MDDQSRPDIPGDLGKGLGRADATRYVAAVSGAPSARPLDAGAVDFDALADEYATRGGINEQFLGIAGRARDDVGPRLAGGPG